MDRYGKDWQRIAKEGKGEMFFMCWFFWGAMLKSDMLLMPCSSLSFYHVFGILRVSSGPAWASLMSWGDWSLHGEDYGAILGRKARCVQYLDCRQSGECVFMCLPKQAVDVFDISVHCTLLNLFTAFWWIFDVGFWKESVLKCFEFFWNVLTFTCFVWENVWCTDRQNETGWVGRCCGRFANNRISNHQVFWNENLVGIFAVIPSNSLTEMDQENWRNHSHIFGHGMPN